MPKELLERLEEELKSGEACLDTAIKIYGYLIECGWNKNPSAGANRFAELYTKYYNDEISAEEFSACGVYSMVVNFLQKQQQLEIVICAAVMAEDGKIYRGHRHGDAMRACAGTGRQLVRDSKKQQGFITSFNRYVTREEGRKLQDAAGIPSADPDGYRGKTLFSEDLY